MFRIAFLSTMSLFVLLQSQCLGQLKLIQVEGPERKFSSYIGEIESQNETRIKLLDLRSAKVIEISKSEVEKIEDATEERCINYCGIEKYVAWRIGHEPQIERTQGKVATTKDGVVYATIGEGSGVVKGEEFQVLRQGEEIRDPDSGKILGRTEVVAAKLVVESVSEKFTKLRRTDEFETPINIGDLIVGNRKSIAVFPLLNQLRFETTGAFKFAEELSVNIAKRSNVDIVERRQLATVMKEKRLQRTEEFSDGQASEIGRLVGADFVVTGTVSRLRNKQTRYFIRCVNVATGKLVFAVRNDVRITPKSAVPPNRVGNGGKAIDPATDLSKPGFKKWCQYTTSDGLVIETWELKIYPKGKDLKFKIVHAENGQAIYRGGTSNTRVAVQPNGWYVAQVFGTGEAKLGFEIRK